MGFEIYYLAKFKRGQIDITESCKEKSDTGHIVSIFDGDVTTHIYEKPEYFKLDEIRNFVINAYAWGDGYSSYIATYREDDGDIFIDFNGSADDIVSDDLKSVCFKDEDGDEEYWEIFIGDKENLLATSAFMSVDEVILNNPNLTLK